MFCQYRVTSVTENTDTFTIFIESTVAACWDDVFIDNFGTPVDKGIHGRKFSMQDSCLLKTSTIFITKYRTNKLLIQSKQQSTNIHFIDEHLEKLYIDVYKKKGIEHSSLGLSKPNKRVKESPIVCNLRNSKKAFKLPCKDCLFVAISVNNMKEHRKSQHQTLKSTKIVSHHTPTVPHLIAILGLM
jgi:hypothetical protein